MAFQWVDEPDDDPDNAGPQQQPPELPAPARQHMRKVEKERDDLKKQLAELLASQRTTTVKGVVEAKGFDPRVAAFIPSTIEVSEEAIGKWLGEYADIFAVKKTETDDGSDGQALPPDMVAAMQQMSNVAGGAQPVTKPQDLMAQINAAATPEALNAILRANGTKI